MTALARREPIPLKREKVSAERILIIAMLLFHSSVQDQANFFDTASSVFHITDMHAHLVSDSRTYSHKCSHTCTQLLTIILLHSHMLTRVLTHAHPCAHTGLRTYRHPPKHTFKHHNYASKPTLAMPIFFTLFRLFSIFQYPITCFKAFTASTGCFKPCCSGKLSKQKLSTVRLCCALELLATARWLDNA